jgi:hypothetical protein
MPLTDLNIGAAPNDGTGETLRSGGAKINTNYTFTVKTDTAQTITGAKTFTGHTTLFTNTAAAPSTREVASFANSGARLAITSTSATSGSAVNDILSSSGGAEVGSAALSFSTRSAFVVGERMRIAANGKITASAGTHWVGTVAQSASSAVVESGSNANGEFVRFADGTQICSLSVSGLGFNLSGSSYYTWTYPIAFSAAPVAQVSTQRNADDTLAIFARQGLTNSSTQSNFSHNGGVSQAVNFNLRAVGRWY